MKAKPTPKQPVVVFTYPPDGGQGFFRRIQLAEPEKSIRYLSGSRVTLGEGATTSTIEIIRKGTFQHVEYGEFSVTDDHLDSFVRNFNENAYGQEIFVDVGHQPEQGAAAKIIKLYREGDKLKALVEWKPYGIQAVRERGMVYLSADYHENWVDNETKKAWGPTLLGAGLVTRPHIKRMQPVQLAEAAGNTVLLINPDFLQTLRQEADKTMNQFLKLLAEAYGTLKLSESVQQPLLDAFKAAAKPLGEDEAALKTLTESYKAMGEAVAKQLAEASGSAPANITVGMTEADVKRLLEADRKQLADQQAATAKKLADNKAAFNKVLDDATGLGDDVRKTLKEAESLITGDMSEDQVKRLAQFQLDQGNKLEAQRKLSDMGFHIQGSPRITVDESNNIKRLSETVTKALKDTHSYINGRLTLPEKDNPFTTLVLAEFDRLNASQLQFEHRVLSGAETTMAKGFMPAAFQREVIREALSDMKILQLVRTAVDAGAQTTTLIPYEELTAASSIPNQGIVYEGAGIPFAGVGLKNDTAYILAMKLALKVTNEIMHFSASNGVNWDAWAENIASNARIMRELVHLRLANAMLRASDTHLSSTITAEAFTVNATGRIRTAQFPVVRPFQARDMAGNTVGNAENPVTITIGGTDIPYYTGAKDLAAGTYWRFSNLNLGYIQLVNQAGEIAGANATGTITYSTTANLIKFDLALPANTKYADHMNSLLTFIGDQKTVLTAQRYSRPEFALMSATLNNEISKASQFAVSLKRDGNNTTMNGDLEQVKGLPAFDTNAPGIDLGDNRILLGQRGLTGYTIAKPYSVGQPFEAVDGGGHPTGEKVAYGEEYSAIHTPKPVRKRFTSVLVYDSTTR